MNAYVQHRAERHQPPPLKKVLPSISRFTGTRHLSCLISIHWWSHFSSQLILALSLLEKFEHYYFVDEMEKDHKDASLVSTIFLSDTSARMIDTQYTYIRLRYHPGEMDRAIALLKIQMKQEAQRWNNSRAATQGGNVNSIPKTVRIASSTDNNKNSGIEALLSLRVVNHRAPVLPTNEVIMYINEEIGYFISSIDLARWWLISVSKKLERKHIHQCTPIPIRHVGHVRFNQAERTGVVKRWIWPRA